MLNIKNKKIKIIILSCFVISQFISKQAYAKKYFKIRCNNKNNGLLSKVLYNTKDLLNLNSTQDKVNNLINKIPSVRIIFGEKKCGLISSKKNKACINATGCITALAVFALAVIIIKKIINNQNTSEKLDSQNQHSNTFSAIKDKNLSL